MTDNDGFVDMRAILDAMDDTSKAEMAASAPQKTYKLQASPRVHPQGNGTTSVADSPSSGDNTSHPTFTLKKDLVMKLEMVFPTEFVTESLGGYQFKTKGILLRALLHRTYKQSKRPRNKTCCDPLDYVGDYVLKFLISQYILEHCPEKHKESLAQRRSLVESQETYAFLAVKNNFHKYVFIQQLGDGSQDYEHLKAYIEGIKNVQTLKELFQVEKRKCFIHNFFQSVAGAIYVDSGYDVKTVADIYLPMLKKYLDEAIVAELDELK
ncbi:uncharacterized protein LOC135399028 [Ornithodoros turicata]|uniref:uncharacterized protein LOC135399028 n=1 Tax=Ornithodoros turicata TaxID=34597 RepID=UPI00313988D8